ncbi:MAG TPA: ATP-binding protein [Anaerolineales bacterium]|nr:ATP-binding protein [Anaerolineales bacterium]
MNKPAEQFKKMVEYTLPWLVLAILLFYSYINFFQHPFGFSWLADGSINHVFVEQTTGSTLMVGDRLVQVGSLTWDAFQSDLRKPFFEGVKTGEVTAVTVERDGQQLTIPWSLPGFNLGELFDELSSQWFLAYAFWIAGLLTVVFLRPKDERWWLFMAYNFLTAIWLMASSGLSNYHLWYSALVLRMAIWLSLPIYLHLHWVFPRPLGKLPRLLIVIAYTIAFALMIAQWFQVLPGTLYFLGFLIALLGSLTLMIIHFFRQVEVRREMGFMAILVFFAFLPTITLGAAYALIGSVPLIGTLVLITFATIPFSYLYIAFRRQLGGLEMRVNRIVSAYFFIILLGILGIPLLAIANRWLRSPDDTLIAGFITALLVAALSIWGFPPFQSFLERRLLGIPATSEQIQESYSTHTSGSTSINALVDLLSEVMLPSLLVRQFLFLQVDNGSTKVLLATGIHEAQFMSDLSLLKLSALKDGTLVDNPSIKSHPWVRLMLPLKLGEEVLGLWLFGKRDPDDFYSQTELPMLQSLANQTAIALSNIIQTERLHAAYQNDIKRTEQGRQRLALELHDGILNKMAMLLMKVDDQNLTPEFQKLYSELTAQLREMIKDLRPATLNFGIQPAIDDYADTLTERLKGKVRIVIDLKSDGSRYSQETELHLLRIVQEACTNALRHASTPQITISGRLENERIELSVQDNGSGFDPKEKLDLKSLQANGHFGMAGMFERAELIGADIRIESEPTRGTRVQIDCKPGRV